MSQRSREGRRPRRSRRGAFIGAVGAALSVIGITLSGCSGVAFVNTVQPRAGVDPVETRAYMQGPRGGVDIYRPKGVAAAPVVVFIYGGSWDSGDRGEYAFVGRSLAREGYLVLIPDYRVFPEVRYPAFLEDCAKAVAWSKAHASEFGGDPNKLFLVGHSAGAYNAVMLGLNGRYLKAVGMDPKADLRGVVGLAGPYDFLPLKSAELKEIFGPPQARPATQPIAYVDGKNPPLFLATDLADKVVDPGNTTRLADRVRAAGGPVEVRTYKGLSHALLIGAFAEPIEFIAPVRRDVARFINAQAGEAGG